MIDVIHIADDYDSALEALNSLIEQAAEATDALEEASTELEQELDTDLRAITESLQELQESAEQGQSGAERWSGEFRSCFSTFAGECGQFQETLNQCQSSVSEAGRSLNTEVEEACGEAKGSEAEALAVIEAAQAALEAVHQSMQSSEESALQIIQKLATAVQESHQQMEGSESEVTLVFGELIESVRQELCPVSQTAMGALAQVVGDQLLSDAGAGIGQLKDVVEDLYSSFEQVTSGIGEDLEQRAMEILSDLATHTCDTAATKVSDSVEDVIGEAITKLSGEIAESVVVTNLGATTTAALSPVLPQLAAAKAVVGAIEKALALLDAVF